MKMITILSYMEGGIIFVLDHITPLQLFSDAFEFKKICVNFL